MVKVIYSDKILDRLSWFMRIGGITLFPFIIMREKHQGTERGKVVLNHEMIHIKQQLECLIIPFYLLYVLNFILNLLLMKKRPYRSIAFEKEAYQNQDNPNYLENRKLFAWLR